jgi:hypothetical protein
MIDIIKNRSNDDRDDDRNNHHLIIPSRDPRRLYPVRNQSQDQDDEDHDRKDQCDVGCYIFIPKPDRKIDYSLTKDNHEQVLILIALSGRKHRIRELFEGAIY